MKNGKTSGEWRKKHGTIALKKTNQRNDGRRIEYSLRPFPAQSK